ncbi:MAG: hypothetical protein AABM67_17200 [Acidobacteriota bacterium]
MFNSGILDVVIGVVVVYLQLSLVCTAVHELVALLLKKRAKELEKGILGLLTKPELVEKFYEHPLIKGLRPDGRMPSYIPSRTFSLALMDIVRRHSFDGTVSAATQDVADKTAARDAAQISQTAAAAALKAAQSVSEAATQALAAADPANKLQASKDAELAANNEAAAKTASDDAEAKLKAAKSARDEAIAYQTQVTKDAATAQEAERLAQAAEAAVKADPKNEGLIADAKAKRAAADTAADALAPTASSLLTGARDKVAGVQTDVVPPELKTALLALLDNAGSNLNKAQANLEQWFDDAMDRVSGTYKRKSHVFVVIIAIVITVLANVDTLQVADALSHDKALRETLVAAAPALAEADRDLVNKERGINPNGSSATPTPAPTPGPTPPGGNTANSTASPSPRATPAPTPSLSTIKASVDEIKKFGVPIGYIRVCTPLEETIVEGCVTAADAADLVKETEAKSKQNQIDFEKADIDFKSAEGPFKSAESILEVAERDFKKAENDLNKAESDLTTAQDNHAKALEENKIATQALISKAQTSRDDAQKTRDEKRKERDGAQKKRDDARVPRDKAQTVRESLAAELAKAQDAYKKAVAKDGEVKRLEETLKKAQEKAIKDPTDENKQAVKEARRRLAFTVECPKCRKASELSPNELKQRLPTTHDYSLLSWDFGRALWELIKDCWNLLYSHWLGWAMTAFALSLGAPFWFDMLNKLIVVRSTVKPHEKSKEQESKDNPDEKDGAKKT